MAEVDCFGVICWFFRWLFSLLVWWSVFAFVLGGIVIGAVLVIGTQVVVVVIGIDEFCGNVCYLHQKFVYLEYKMLVHYVNCIGVCAMCVDCYVFYDYLVKLIYKVKVGIIDVYAEVRGTIATQEKFDRECWRFVNYVWDQMRVDNSANCCSCYDDKVMDSAKQFVLVVKQYQKFCDGKVICIDCHIGVAHKEFEELKVAAKKQVWCTRVSGLYVQQLRCGDAICADC